MGGGATRNGEALYDLPRHKLVHHLLADVPVRTSSLRGLGAYANVFAIESFIDELAEVAGVDPVTYRLSLTSDPRARRVIETAAEMGGWFNPAGLGEGRARGFAFARYKNRAAYMAAVAEVEVDAEVRLTRVWGCVDAGLVINPDGAANQVEGGIIQAASWALKEQVRFADGQVATTTWEAYPILRFSEVPEIELRFIAAPNEPPLGLGEVAMGPTGGGDRQCGCARARRAPARSAVDARAHHGDAVERERNVSGRKAMKSLLRSVSVLLAGAGLLVGASRADAQDLSAKPIKIIVGLAAGGATDVMARLVAQKMSESLRTTVFVENRAGGIFIPASARPDGRAGRRSHAVLHLHQHADHPAAASGLPVRSHGAHPGHAGRHRTADPGGAQGLARQKSA